MNGDAIDEPGQEASEHRIRRRVHVLLPASIATDGQQWDVRLRNLSCTGALIESNAPVEPQMTLRFVRAGAEREATVVWVREGRVGLAFGQPFTEEEVAALTRRERPPAKSVRRA